jgi:diketogulonate reductase-like aldo/keto reductase
VGGQREDLFVTTKLWCTYHSRVEENLDQSLKLLGLEYVDLYLMHWPCPMKLNGVLCLFLLNTVHAVDQNLINQMDTFYRQRLLLPKKLDGSRDLDIFWSRL